MSNSRWRPTKPTGPATELARTASWGTATPSSRTHLAMDSHLPAQIDRRPTTRTCSAPRRLSVRRSVRVCYAAGAESLRTVARDREMVRSGSPEWPADTRTMVTSAPGADEGLIRWRILGVISLGVVALTLNWFDVATAFPPIRSQFHVGPGSVSLLISLSLSLYIVGFGLSHIPGGMLATRIGMKQTIVAGLAVQGASGVMSGRSVDYTELAIFRRNRHLVDNTVA